MSWAQPNLLKYVVQIVKLIFYKTEDVHQNSTSNTEGVFFKENVSHCFNTSKFDFESTDLTIFFFWCSL